MSRPLLGQNLGDQLRRYRKDTRWVVGALALGLLALSSIYYLVQRSRELPSDVATQQVLLFALSYVNLVLIIIIIFVLLRNLLKLAVERHHKILGSKFKIKLVATYIALSLIPVLLLFVYGSQLLQGWIDRWFDEAAMKRVTEEGYAVAQGLNREYEARNRFAAERALVGIAGLDLVDTARRPALADRLQALLADLGVDYLAVYEGSEFVHAVLLPQAGLGDLPEPGPRFLLQAVAEGGSTKVHQLAGEQGRLILSAVAAAAPQAGAEAAPGAVVVAGTLMDPELALRSERLIQAYQGYRQLEVRKSDIEVTYRLIFLMVTLIILLGSSWVGLYLARRVTVPIEAMAEGTRRLSQGDLDYRVEVPADDELGVLVESFNRMTADLKRNKEDLLEANRRLGEERALVAAILDNVAAGIVSVDYEGRILTVNRAARRLLELEGERFIGSPVDSAWGDGERAKLAQLFALSTRSSKRLVRTVRLFLGGQWKTFEAKVRAMPAAGGGGGGRVMVLEDLTELIEAQQMAAWTDAARRIAHEIKNPLTPIKLSAERILKKYRDGDADLGEALEDGVRLIGKEVQSMKAMVDEFSRFARMRPPRPAETDMESLVKETLGLYEGLKKGVEIDSRIGAGARRAVLDREQIKRVLINLLDNALEATEPPGQVAVALEKDNGDLRIEVADTGSGVPAEIRDKLFLPHVSTKGRGTGLGLSIVHRIVGEHHGEVSVGPNSPHGTVFSIRLPQG